MTPTGTSEEKVVVMQDPGYLDMSPTAFSSKNQSSKFSMKYFYQRDFPEKLLLKYIVTR